MKIFRMIPDWDRAQKFQVDHFPDRDKLGNAMLAGESLLDRWQATPVSFSLAVTDRGATSDFVEAGWTYARFGVNGRAAEALRSWIADCCELLPFNYQGSVFWVLYVRTADCLNQQQTIFHNRDEGMRSISIAAFHSEKLPSHPLFRVPRGNDYYVTEELKRHIEQVQLTGVRFQFMWSDDGSEPAETAVPESKPQRRRKRAKKSPADSPRELLLARLWNDVILPRGDLDELEKNLAIARFNAHSGGAPERHDSSRIVRQLVRAGLAKTQILELLRSLAYEVVFETLVVFEEEGLDDSPEFSALHEDLLMAEPE